MDTNPALDELIEQAINAPGKQKKSLIGKATGQVLPGKPKKKGRGRPTLFNQKIADEIVSRIAGGQVLPTITKELNISPQNIYDWLDRDQNFLERYNRARERQAKTLVDSLLSESEDLQNDRALAVRVRADIVRWVAARYAPAQFADSKRIELSAEINHRHVHQLEDHQKRKIAEAWLISQQDDSLGITAETTGPDLETGVQVVSDEPARIVPKKKKPSLPKIKQANPDDHGWVGRREIAD